MIERSHLLFRSSFQKRIGESHGRSCFFLQTVDQPAARTYGGIPKAPESSYSPGGPWQERIGESLKPLESQEAKERHQIPGKNTYVATLTGGWKTGVVRQYTLWDPHNPKPNPPIRSNLPTRIFYRNPWSQIGRNQRSSARKCRAGISDDRRCGSEMCTDPTLLDRDITFSTFAAIDMGPRTANPSTNTRR